MRSLVQSHTALSPGQASASRPTPTLRSVYADINPQLRVPKRYDNAPTSQGRKQGLGAPLHWPKDAHPVSWGAQRPPQAGLQYLSPSASNPHFLGQREGPRWFESFPDGSLPSTPSCNVTFKKYHLINGLLALCTARSPSQGIWPQPGCSHMLAALPGGPGSRSLLGTHAASFWFRPGRGPQERGCSQARAGPPRLPAGPPTTPPGLCRHDPSPGSTSRSPRREISTTVPASPCPPHQAKHPHSLNY